MGPFDRLTAAPEAGSTAQPCTTGFVAIAWFCVSDAQPGCSAAALCNRSLRASNDSEETITRRASGGAATALF